MSQFEQVAYKDLKPKQQEIYNFQKLAAKLADYGFNCIKLTDDWEGADFLAYRSDIGLTLKVQQKVCLTIKRSYLGKELWMAFRMHKQWYLIEHDTLKNLLGEHTIYLKSSSWKDTKGTYSAPHPSKVLKEILAPYCLH